MAREEDVVINVKINIDEETRRVDALGGSGSVVAGLTGGVLGNSNRISASNRRGRILSDGMRSEDLFSPEPGGSLVKKGGVVTQQGVPPVSKTAGAAVWTAIPQKPGEYEYLKKWLNREHLLPTPLPRDSINPSGAGMAPGGINEDVRKLRNMRRGTILNPAVVAVAGSQGAAKIAADARSKFKEAFMAGPQSVLSSMALPALLVEGWKAFSKSLGEELERSRKGGSISQFDMEKVATDTWKNFEKGTIEKTTSLLGKVTSSVAIGLAGMEAMFAKFAAGPGVGFFGLGPVQAYENAATDMLTWADMLSGNMEQRRQLRIKVSNMAADRSWGRANDVAENLIQMGFTYGNKGQTTGRVDLEIGQQIKREMLEKVGLIDGAKK